MTEFVFDSVKNVGFCRGSRVVIFIFIAFFFGRKISRFSGIYRNARMLIHAFPLFGTSYFTFTCLGNGFLISLAFSLACFACYKFRLFGAVFFDVLFGENSRKPLKG